MKLVIERSKWYRGKGDKDSRLLVTKSLVPEDNGKMCCLGFCALMLGVPKEYIENVGMPMRRFLEFGVPEWFGTNVFDKDRQELYDFACTNDDTTLDEEYREARITELFAKKDIQVEFVD